MLFQYNSSELRDTRHISYTFKHVVKVHDEESQQNFLCKIYIKVHKLVSFIFSTGQNTVSDTN